jgi:dihydroorotase
LGVRIFTDDGRGVQDAQLMRRALEYASDLGVILAEHCEDESLAQGAPMHEGAWSARLGLSGQPSLAEEQMVARDLALVRLTGAPMHFLHLSTAGSVALVRDAKRDGLPITAEATPHHLQLTDAAVAGYDARFKVNPPLRGEADVLAVRAGVADGTIDAIATDHAPHPAEAKSEPFDLAPPGMIGLETALAVSYGALVLTGLVEPSFLIASFTSRPAAIAGLQSFGHGGPIVAGGVANICVFDPTARWIVDPEMMASRSANSPFTGDELTGSVRHNVVFGEVVVEAGEATR